MLVVQKFGGTSVADADAILRLIAIVRTARVRDGQGPAVVVSVMSGVTDSLLAMAGEAGSLRVEHAASRLGQLRDRHLAAARALVPDADLGALVAQMDEQLDELGAVVATRTSPSWV